MSSAETASNQRNFRCIHCSGKILIPKDLPPTTGPCPHCGGVITSPALDASPPVAAWVAPAPAPSAIPVAAAISPAIPIPSAIPTQQSVAVPMMAPRRDPVPLQAQIPEASIVRAQPPVPPANESPREIELPPRNPAVATNHPKNKNAVKSEKPRRSRLVPVMLVLLLLVAGGAATVYFVSKELGRDVAPLQVDLATPDPAISEANYIRIGWQKDAYDLLANYMAGTTSQDKQPFILNAERLAARVEDFYGGGMILDSDTPAEAFSIYELSEEDRKRGLFMMIYDQPPQFEMKEFFRPLASLEVQHGVDEADLLLSTLARVGNFAMEPMRVHAFFKRTPEGLKLDWEIFSQTKYRTFQNFVELPEVGQSEVFRVFIVEDVPEKGRAAAGTRTYRLADPANTGDTTRINVKVDSETGRTLSIINWRDTRDNQPITRTATVELKWTGENHAPELVIERFICWEFLGLGGEETPATASTQ